MAYQNSEFRIQKSEGGFSLIEISIVLVIIALLTGSMLALQTLLQNTQVKSVLVNVETFKNAFNNFQAQYGALPGDLSNATSFWGAAHAVAATCKTTSTGSKATCNGDGNGTISTESDSATYYERYRAWQQLANAGFIQGNFTGVQGSGGVSEAVIGVNSPAAEIPGAGWSIRHHWASGGANWFTPTAYGHFLILGGFVAGDTTNAAMLEADKAMEIDNKIDDGLPGSGKVMSFTSNYQPTCASTAVPATAVYLQADSLPACSLIFLLGF